MTPSTLIRARAAVELARAHYERGNYARSLRQVWRIYAFPQLGICYHTFLRYLRAEGALPDSRHFRHGGADGGGWSKNV